MFGASVYQRISLIPEWGGALPQSVVLYFRDPHAGQAIDRFWTLVTAPTAVAIILALIVNWPFVVRRRWISRGAILFFLLLAWTAVYFIPKGVMPLMVRGGDGLTPEAITQMARASDLLGLVSYGRDARVIPVLCQGSHSSVVLYS